MTIPEKIYQKIANRQHLTKGERLAKMAADIARCKAPDKQKTFYDETIQGILSQVDKLELTEDDIAILKTARWEEWPKQKVSRRSLGL